MGVSIGEHVDVQIEGTKCDAVVRYVSTALSCLLCSSRVGTVHDAHSLCHSDGLAHSKTF